MTMTATLKNATLTQNGGTLTLSSSEPKEQAAQSYLQFKLPLDGTSELGKMMLNQISAKRIDQEPTATNKVIYALYYGSNDDDTVTARRETYISESNPDYMEVVNVKCGPQQLKKMIMDYLTKNLRNANGEALYEQDHVLLDPIAKQIFDKLTREQYINTLISQNARSSKMCLEEIEKNKILTAKISELEQKHTQELAKHAVETMKPPTPSLQYTVKESGEIHLVAATKDVANVEDSKTSILQQTIEEFLKALSPYKTKKQSIPIWALEKAKLLGVDLSQI